MERDNQTSNEDALDATTGGADNQGGIPGANTETDIPQSEGMVGFAAGASSGGALDDTTTASVGSAAMGGLGTGRSMGGSVVNDMSGAGMGSGSRDGSSLDNMSTGALESQRGQASETGVKPGVPTGNAMDNARTSTLDDNQ